MAAIEQGDINAADELLPLVYEELGKFAAHRMANETAGRNSPSRGPGSLKLCG